MNWDIQIIIVWVLLAISLFIKERPFKFKIMKREFYLDAKVLKKLYIAGMGTIILLFVRNMIFVLFKINLEFITNEYLYAFVIAFIGTYIARIID